MQVASIANISSNTNFKSEDNIQNASDFVNMNDKQLKKLAYKLSYNKKEVEEKTQKTLLATLCAIPIIDSISKGLLAKNAFVSQTKDYTGIFVEKSTQLSTKAKAGIKTAGMWGAVLGILGIYSATKNAFTPQNKKTDKHNPVASFLVDVGVMIGGLALITMGFNEIIEQFPEKVGKMRKGFNKFLEKLDKTSLNKKTLPDLEKFAAKHPVVATTGKVALAYSMWITLGVGIYKMFNNVIEQRKKVDNTFEQLKINQNITAKQLVNVMNVEKDVLAQGQQDLAVDLRKAMNGEKPVSQKEIAELREKAKMYEETKNKFKPETKQAENKKLPKKLEITYKIEFADASEKISKPDVQENLEEICEE